MIASGGFGALVALRAKQGEFTALEAFDRTEQLRYLQPLLEFEESAGLSVNRLDAVEVVVRKLHQRRRPVMIDACGIAGPHRFGGGSGGALGELADRLAYPVDLLDEHYPVPFIPVVRGDATDDEVAVFGRLCQETGLGGALRIRTATADRENIKRIIERLGLDTADLDLVIDLQYVPEVTDRLVERVAASIGAVAEFGPFRTTSVLSGSIPGQLGGTSTWQQLRAEERLWQSLVRGGFAELRFGDYGVVHPLSSSGYPSKHVSVKYTCLDHWLYSRERMPEAENGRSRWRAESSRARTFRTVCRSLVESDGFAGPDFSWGDQQILDAAEGRGQGLGSTSKPVAFATSHHLAYLASRAAV